ncbi:MAG: hypothetical protein AAFN77_05740 [Planctomycetota bacterium]
MKRLSFFGQLSLSMFSKPVTDRVIYKLIKQNQFESFVEVGLGDGSRLERIIQFALTYSNSDNLRYTGVDRFDARPEEQSPLRLIDMHKKMKSIPAKTQLVPGELEPAIRRIANSHLRIDMVILSAGFQEQQFANAVMFFPRMMHSGSKLLVQRQGNEPFEVLTRLDVERLAAQHEGKSSRQVA